MIEVSKLLGREKIKGNIIMVCLLVLTLSIIGIHFLDVKIINIELADKGLYTIVTTKGPVNITPGNIIRIERTYTKAAITGVPIILEKIYTDKGFIYFSDLDPFAETGREIADTVDPNGLTTWSRHNTTLHTIQPYAYAIGTPKSNVPVVFLLMFLQYLSLTTGGITLFVLISPFHRRNNYYQTMNAVPQETDFRTTEEQFGAVAK